MTYLQPLVFLLLLGFLTARCFLQKSKGRGWLTAATLALFLISWPPADWLFSRPLETISPRNRFPQGSAEAIVVLSGGVLPREYYRPYRLPDFETFRRCTHAAWLFHSWHRLPVLASGGLAGKQHTAYAATMRELLLQTDIPDEMIWTEDRSRNTYENAVFSAQILRQHGVSRIALVVDARSMPRAAACFRKQGITVVPAASEFREIGRSWEDWFPSWKSIGENEITLHESIGLLWYWLRGRI
jgi:uncharacterized SAM-binding protein YcdF (DUF218 family)